MQISMLLAQTRDCKVRWSYFYWQLAHSITCLGFSGADLSALVREAGLAVLSDWRSQRAASSSSENNSNDLGASSNFISRKHLDYALGKVKPSVNIEDRKRYEKVKNYITQGMGAIEALKKAKHEK